MGQVAEMSSTSSSHATFEAPGPGRWELETAHWGGRFTPFLRVPFEAACTSGFSAAGERYGLPLANVQLAFVNDHVYVRPIPLVEPKRTPKSSPPAALVWLLSRLHPAFRRRHAAARAALRDQSYRRDVDTWRSRTRQQVIDANFALQATDVSSLDDQDLADHLERCLAHFSTEARRHFELSAAMLVGLGDLFVHLERWGVSTADGFDLLRGSSPASSEPRQILEPAARAVADHGGAPATIDDVRSLAPEAASAIDQYLRLHGQRVVARFDVDAPRLIEQPALVVAAVRGLAAANRVTDVPDSDAVRERIPAAHRAELDEMLAVARDVYGTWDDNAGVALQWPIGLVRRGLLDAARRLRGDERIVAEDHVFDAQADEIMALLRGRPSVSADELASRHAERRAHLAAQPPSTIGAEPEPPSPALLPAALARVAAAAGAAIGLVFTPESPDGLSGVGVGSSPYRGRARIVRDADHALAELEPGEVLVTSYTTPAYNAVLPVAGALVTASGGLLSHGAVVARELGLPAVIGAVGALDEIPDGATVDVDPISGSVRIVS